MRLNRKIANIYILIFIGVIIWPSCNTSKRLGKEFSVYMKDPKYRFQYIISEVSNRKLVTIEDKTLKNGAYWYPASTVKLPVTLMAFEKLKDLKISMNDTLITYGIDGKSIIAKETFATYAHQVFTVSDNAAYNRLFEFCGPDHIHKRLRDMGYKHAKIIHRVGPLETHGLGGHEISKMEVINTEGEIKWSSDYYNYTPIHDVPLYDTLQGRGYLSYDDNIVYEPFDFGKKNYLPLSDLQQMMIGLMDPLSVSERQRWDLTTMGKILIQQYMMRPPRESLYYAKDSLPDNYVKFLCIGDEGEDFIIPSTLRIYNKVGLAYGYVTDVACINYQGRQYYISASIRVNENEIYNDGIYEYDSIAFKVLGALGKKAIGYIPN